jgi:competence ComEA-like helix-hairpin-helix protein
MVPSVDDDADLIDLASATEEDLCRLVGVGPALAKNIIAWREENGGFTSVDELGGIKGIGAGRLELLRPQVTLGEAADAPRVAPPGAPPAADEADGAKGERVPEDHVLGPERVRVAPRRALARRRLPAVVDTQGPGVEGERSLGGFLRENGLNLALVGVALAVQLLVIILIVWVL